MRDTTTTGKENPSSNRGNPGKETEDRPTSRRIIFATRSMYEDLYGLSSDLLDVPFPKLRLTGTKAHGYLYRLLDLQTDWVVNVDEDAFVWDVTAIERIIEHMEQNGFACCGCPDGGAVPIRFHNPLVPNPFFNVFSLKLLRKHYKNLAEITRTRFERGMARHTPPFVEQGTARGSFKYDMFERYYCLYLWILKKGMRILYLDAEQWPGDGVSSILKDHEGNPFLIHTWFARKWKHPEHRKRISQAYQHALGMKDQGTRQ